MTTEDHDLLIEINTTVHEIRRDVKKQNGRLDKHDGQINNINETQARHDERIQDVEERPSPTKAIWTVGVIIGVFNIGTIGYLVLSAAK